MQQAIEQLEKALGHLVTAEKMICTRKTRPFIDMTPLKVGIAIDATRTCLKMLKQEKKE